MAYFQKKYAIFAPHYYRANSNETIKDNKIHNES